MRAQTKSAERQTRHAGRACRQPGDGFTLVEMIGVLGVIGLVGTLAGPPMIRYLGADKPAAAKYQIGQIAAALERYYVDVGRYPSVQDGLVALVNSPSGTARWRGPYLKTAGDLDDPWGHPYAYCYPNAQGAFAVTSLGRDNAPGAALASA